MSNIPSNQLPLRREEYYILPEKKTKNSVPIKFNNHLAYLHRETRGFATYGFTHKDLQSIVKLMIFAFFGFKCVNVDELLERFDATKINLGEETNHSTKELKKCHYGEPRYIKCEMPGNYEQTQKFRLVDLCNFINNRFNCEISRIISQPITTTYNNTYPFFYCFKRSTKKTIFQALIAPTVYDFVIIRCFLRLIENPNIPPP